MINFETIFVNLMLYHILFIIIFLLYLLLKDIFVVTITEKEEKNNPNVTN